MEGDTQLLWTVKTEDTTELQLALILSEVKTTDMTLSQGTK